MACTLCGNWFWEMQTNPVIVTQGESEERRVYQCQQPLQPTLVPDLPRMGVNTDFLLGKQDFTKSMLHPALTFQVAPASPFVAPFEVIELVCFHLHPFLHLLSASCLLGA